MWSLTKPYQRPTSLGLLLLTMLLVNVRADDTVDPIELNLKTQSGLVLPMSECQDVIVKMSSTSLRKGDQYIMTFEENRPQYNILASFVSYEYPSFHEKLKQVNPLSHKNCIYDRIHLKSNGTDMLPGSSEGYCQHAKPGGFFILPNSAQILITTPMSTSISASFTVLFTSAFVKANVTDPCPFGYYNCGSSQLFCIRGELTCNGYNDCGNDADETDDECINRLTAGVLAVIIICSIIFPVPVCIFCIIFVRRRMVRANYIQHQ